jgi:hypothetical protein
MASEAAAGRSSTGCPNPEPFGRASSSSTQPTRARTSPSCGASAASWRIVGRVSRHPATVPDGKDPTSFTPKRSTTSPGQQPAVERAAREPITEQRDRMPAHGEVLTSDHGQLVVLLWRWHGSRPDLMDRDERRPRTAPRIPSSPAPARSRPQTARRLVVSNAPPRMRPSSTCSYPTQRSRADAPPPPDRWQPADRADLDRSDPGRARRACPKLRRGVRAQGQARDHRARAAARRLTTSRPRENPTLALKGAPYRPRTAEPMVQPCSTPTTSAWLGRMTS